MNQQVKSIRPFIGAKNFDVSSSFYRDLGFQESILSPGFSYFHASGLGFYLQDGYVKDWIDNTMVFLEVEDAARFYDDLLALNLPLKYKGVRLTPVRDFEWGRECYLYDPSGVLWHFGEFSAKK